MPRITHDSDKPNQNHLALLCMMDDSAQDSGIAMYGVAKDLPIIVRYYRAGSFRRGRRAGSMSTGHGLRPLLHWQHKSCQLHPIMDTEQDGRARWKHHLWLPVASVVWWSRRAPALITAQRSHHRRGGAAGRGAARLLWVPCKQAKLKGAPCSC